jgi:hypothetical protein
MFGSTIIKATAMLKYKCLLRNIFRCSDNKIAGNKPISKNIILYLLKKPKANAMAVAYSHFELLVLINFTMVK